MVTRRPISLHGSGHIAAVHAVAAHALGFSIAAVASRSPSKASALAGRLGARATRYDDLPIGPGSLTVVATPPANHAAAVAAALTRGGDVVVEKPLCTTLADADRLVDLAARAPGRLFYGENLLHAPIVDRLLAEAAHLGPATYIEARALQGRPRHGDYLLPEWGGGVLFDLGVHPLALALLLGRPARVVQVSARLQLGTAHPTDEHADVELTFSDGARGRVVASWLAGPEPVWDAQKASDDGVVRAEMLPTPRLESDGEEIPLGPSADTDFVTDLGFVGQLDACSRSPRDTAETPAGPAAPRATTAGAAATATFGREILDIVCAAYSSARDARPWAVPFSGRRDLSPWELWQR